MQRPEASTSMARSASGSGSASSASHNNGMARTGSGSGSHNIAMAPSAIGGASKPRPMMRPRGHSFSADRAVRMSPPSSPHTLAPPLPNNARLRKKFSTETMRSGQLAQISVPLPHQSSSSTAGLTQPPTPTVLSPTQSLVSPTQSSMPYSPLVYHHSLTAGSSRTANGDAAGGAAGFGAHHREKSGTKDAWYQRGKRSGSSAAAMGPPSLPFLEKEKENKEDNDADDASSIRSFTCRSCAEFDRQYKFVESHPVPPNVLGGASDAQEIRERSKEFKQSWLDDVFSKLTSKARGKKKDGVDTDRKNQAGTAHFLDFSSFISPLPSPAPGFSLPTTSPLRPSIAHNFFSADAVPTSKSLGLIARRPAFSASGAAQEVMQSTQQQRELRRKASDLARKTVEREAISQQTTTPKKGGENVQTSSRMPSLPSWAREQNRGLAMARTSSDIAPQQSRNVGLPMARALSDDSRTQQQRGGMHGSNNRPILPARASSSSQSSSTADESTQSVLYHGHSNRESVSSFSTDSTSSPKTPSSATLLKRQLYGTEMDPSFPAHPPSFGGADFVGDESAGAAGIGAHMATSALMLTGMDEAKEYTNEDFFIHPKRRPTSPSNRPTGFAPRSTRPGDYGMVPGFDDSDRTITKARIAESRMRRHGWSDSVSSTSSDHHQQQQRVSSSDAFVYNDRLSTSSGNSLPRSSGSLKRREFLPPTAEESVASAM